MYTLELVAQQEQKLKETISLLQHITQTLDPQGTLAPNSKKFIPTETLYNNMTTLSLFLIRTPNLLIQREFTNILQLYKQVENLPEDILKTINLTLGIPRKILETSPFLLSLDEELPIDWSIYNFLIFLFSNSIGFYNCLETNNVRNTFLKGEIYTILNDIKYLYSNEYQLILNMVYKISTLKEEEIPYHHKYLVARLLTFGEIILTIPAHNLYSGALIGAINLLVSPPTEYLEIPYQILVLRLINTMYLISYMFLNIKGDPRHCDNILINDTSPSAYKHLFPYKRQNIAKYSTRSITYPNFIGSTVNMSSQLFQLRIPWFFEYTPTPVNYDNNGHILSPFDKPTPTHIIQTYCLNYMHINVEIIRAILLNRSTLEVRDSREPDTNTEKLNKVSFLELSKEESYVLHETLPISISYGERTEVLSPISTTSISESEIYMSLITHPLKTPHPIFPSTAVIFSDSCTSNPSRVPMFISTHKMFIGFLIPTHKDIINHILTLYGQPENDYIRYTNAIGKCIKYPAKNSFEFIIPPSLVYLKYDASYETLKAFLRIDLIEVVDMRFFFNRKDTILSNGSIANQGLFIPIAIPNPKHLSTLLQIFTVK